jgi:hypothetical protein
MHLGVVLSDKNIHLIHVMLKSVCLSFCAAGHVTESEYSDYLQVHQPESPTYQQQLSLRQTRFGMAAPTWVHPIIMRLGRDATGDLVEGGDAAPTLWDRFWRSL